MDSKHLEQLLTQQESGFLDFKQEFYKLDTGADEARKREKHELIKDILALATGNPSVAGETAYLVFGASDKTGPDGSRTLRTVNENVRTRESLLQIVNDACAPPLDDLRCEFVSVAAHQLFVITIPASLHVHETTKRLDTPRRTYNKYTVFMRQGDRVQIAAAADRDAMRERKRQRFAESTKAPPVLLGAVVAALIGWIGGSEREAAPDDQVHPPVTCVLTSAFSGLTGALLGAVYREVVRGWYDQHKWHNIPPRLRKPFFFGALAVSGGGSYVMGRILNRKKK